MSRVTCLASDLSKDDLGLSQKAFSDLSEIDVVIHVSYNASLYEQNGSQRYSVLGQSTLVGHYEASKVVRSAVWST